MTDVPTAGAPDPDQPAAAPPARARVPLGRVLRVGGVLAISVAILVALLVITGPLAVIRGTTVRVDFAFAGPIKPGASVRMSGVVVGAVRSVDLLAGQDREAGPDKIVRVTATIEDRAMVAVTERAVFRVTTLGVLGEHYLDIEPVPGGAVLVENARVNGESQARADLLLARASSLLERAEELLPSSPEARELMTSLAALSRRLDGVLAGDQTDDVVAELRALLHGAAVGVGDGTSLKRTLDKMPGVLDRTDALEQQLGKELEGARLSDLVGELRGTMGRLDRTLEMLQAAPVLDPQKQEQLRQDVTAAARSIDAVAKRADRLLGAVEQGKGGAGKLFWDEQAAADLKAVLAGLRKDPLKFLLSPSPDR